MSTSSEEDILVHLPFGSWYRSTDSILTEKTIRLTHSESTLTFSDCTSNVFFSQMGSREMRIKREVPQPTLLTIIPTRNELKQELEILKINLSTDIDKVIALRQSQMVALRKKGRRRRRRRKESARSRELSEITELLTEIERSDSVKTDKVIWKFLRRSSSFRKEALDNRSCQVVRSLDFQFPGARNFCFQNAQPVKMTCPNCKFFVTTNVKHMSSVRSNLNSIVQSLVGLCIARGIPQSFKDSVHSCPLCEIYLGYCPAFNITFKRDSISKPEGGIRLDKYNNKYRFLIPAKFPFKSICLLPRLLKWKRKMVSASSTSAKNLFVESKLRLSDRVQVNVNNIAAITRQIQRGSKSSENLMTAAKNFALQEAAIENSETNLKKLKLLTTHLNNHLDSLHTSASKMEMVLEQVCSMQR